MIAIDMAQARDDHRCGPWSRLQRN